ncbi:hypothetical protein JMM81_05250 [Bacillus sp. V3B]|uniref:hypothetical protein n=1 Tax=Bacillus sp. V3B TaxID=2804915 RepID=UPI00210C28B3|nr:hypothetical protein [Bacillus sp. V3B]MCQ6274385.1 hypothetical protein [Bacillus sp. V3B]
MKSSEPKRQLHSFIYDEQGTKEVSEQIMNAYNSGVIDQEDGSFHWNDGQQLVDR